MLSTLQISKELKQYHNVDHLDDVRIIRDRQTSEKNPDLSTKSY